MQHNLRNAGVEDGPNAVGEWHWDAFLGETGVALLSEDTNDSLARELAALGVTAYHHCAIRRTMQRAFDMRVRLAGDFQQLQDLALLWSGVHALVRRSQRLDSDAELWCHRANRLIGAFINGKLPSTRGQLARANCWTARAMDRMERKRLHDGLGFPRRSSRPQSRQDLGREPPAIDVEILRAAFNWVDSRAASSPAERREMQAFVSSILDITLKGLEQPTDVRWQKIERPKYDFDRWLLDKVAREVSATDSPEERMSLWQPLLDMGRPGHRWITQFFWAWFTGGLQGSGNVPGFVARWSDMVEYAIGHPLWDPANVGTHYLDDMIVEMLGLGLGLQTVADDERFTTELSRMQDVFARAAKKWFSVGRVTSMFAAFVSQPGAALLLKPGLTWLHDACLQFDESYDGWRQQGIEENLVGVLQACWNQHATDVLSEGDLSAPFRGLLNILCARRNHAALVLRDDILG
ncbi:MAG: hypothetical protein GY832_30040 [Chloroflexi bacterium]|nr:hypothetical protein [Chloroflexota bacterium]